MRLDLYLFANGFAESRQKAKYLLESGAVCVNGKPCTKPSLNIDGQTVEVKGEGLRYVSRGGLKLEGALTDFALYDYLQGKIAADLGASTGGFTHCLLENGVKKVYAIDSGSEQLHPTLRSEPRVISMENCNARALTTETLPEKCDLAVMDLSFISQTLLYPVIPAVLAENGLLLSLIKPQFEAGRSEIGKKGIVKDRKVHLRVLEDLLQKAYAEKLYAVGITQSKLPGGDGNLEYFALFRLGGDPVAPFPRQALLRTVQYGEILRSPHLTERNHPAK